MTSVLALTVAFPLVVFAVLVALLLGAMQKERRSTVDWREAFIAAALIWGALVVLISEALSLVDGVARPLLTLCWGLALIFLLLYGWRTELLPQVWHTRVRNAARPEITKTGWTLIGLMGVYAGVLWIIAVLAPPNTNDALNYHMSRVMHWGQNQSLAPFATAVNHQIWMPPWAELVILHLLQFAGTDRLSNLVQWSSLMASVLGVSLLAKQLGANAQAQILTAVFAMTVPMGILQASSAQNDLVVSFWVVALAHYILAARDRTLGVTEWGLAALAVGLGMLTKGTFYAFGLVFLCWLLVISLRRYGWAASARFALLGLTIAVLLNAGVWIRNIQTYQFPFGPQGLIRHLSNNDFGISPLASNTVRNVSLHLATPLDELNSQVNAVVLSLHGLAGLDANDPDTTLGSFDVRGSGWRHEDFAGNPLHFALVPVSLLLLLWPGAQIQRKPALTYALAVVATFIVFSALYKWQPWGSRLQLPFFILWSPAAGLALSQNRYPWLGLAVAALLLISGTPQLLLNASRPLLPRGSGPIQSVLQTPRDELLFANIYELRSGYRKVTRAVSETACQDVGLRLDSWEPEYPYWVLLSAFDREIQLETLEPPPPLERYERADFQPCAIICTVCAGRKEYRGLELVNNFENHFFLYLPADREP